MRIIPKGVKIPKNWEFMYLERFDDFLLYHYKDHLGKEYIYKQVKEVKNK